MGALRGRPRPRGHPGDGMKLEWSATRLELTEPLRISRAAMIERDAVTVTLSHEDLRGCGEVVTSPRLGVSITAITRALDEAAHWMAFSTHPEQLRTRLPELRARLHHILPVAAAVDVAVHDYLAVHAGVPLWEYLEVPVWDSVPTAYTIGIMPVDPAVEAAERLVRSGFSVLKLKLGSADIAADLARVRAVRAVAPSAGLLLDPNGAWDAATAVSVLTELASTDIAAVEQPVPAGHPDELDVVARSVPMPVIADEDAGSLADLRALPASIRGINIKLAECGGVDAALAMIDWAAGAGVDVLLGCQASTSLGIAPAAHLSGVARWVDLDGHLLIADDPWHGLGGSDGVLRRPDGAGLGVRHSGPA